MIKVEYLDDVVLREWYWEHVKYIIGRNKKKSLRNALEKIWAERLTDLDILYDIIFEELSVLVLRYKWIGDYVEKCNQNDSDQENNIIMHYIDEKKLTAKIRVELMDRMNVRVCPYCNQQYIYMIHGRDTVRYLGDLDHVMPKKRYPLFALSLWNLVPACKSCNQIFKGKKQKEILSPLEDGFGEDCIFRIKYHNVEAIRGASTDFDVEWSNCAKDIEKKNKITNNIDVFQLNEIYKVHKREIQLILWKKAVFSNIVYRKSINSIIKSVDNGGLEMEMLLYGMDLSEDKLGEQPHAKMTHDLIKYN